MTDLSQRRRRAAREGMRKLRERRDGRLRRLRWQLILEEVGLGAGAPAVAERLADLYTVPYRRFR